MACSCEAENAKIGDRKPRINDVKPAEVDIFRDTLVRYLGYANEVGESFRALIPGAAVLGSYVVASGYVVADAGYKGYKASKVSGESYRALIPGAAVLGSYVVASGYVVADAGYKGYKASKMNWGNESTSKKVVHVMGDTLVWQGLASVAIPGFTINRLCKLSHYVLAKSTSLPMPARKWTTTAIGLAAIPFIIKPIDRSVDFGMNNTVRRWYHIEPKEEQIVHHRR